MLPIVLLLISYMSTMHCGSIYCKDYEECVKDDLYEKDTNIYCSGDEACADVTQVVGKQVYCTGHRACYDVSNLYADDGSLLCYGYQSCTGVNIMKAYGSNSIQCSGHYGCYDSTHIQISSATTGAIYCTGYFGCYAVGRLYAPTVYCTGQNSCRSSPSTTVTVYSDVLHATGDLAMYDSKYVCDEDSASCTIYCEGSGCRGLSVIYPNKVSDITIQPQGCKAAKNQGNDIGTDEIIMWCPVFLTAEEYAAGGGKMRAIDDADDEVPDMELFKEVDNETFLSSYGSTMNANQFLLFGSMMVNGIVFASCIYNRYKKKEYIPL